MKRLLFTGVIVVALAAGARAQEPTGTLLGFVVDAGSFAPIENAYVTIMPGNYMARTNAVGYFVLNEVPYATYAVLVTTEGYKNYSDYIEVDNPVLTLFNAGLTATTATEGEENPVGILTGFVMSTEGLLPVADATITLAPGGMFTGTADLGTFLLTDVIYGDYTVQATAFGYEPATVDVTIDSTIPVTINIMMAPVQTEGESETTGTIVGFILDDTTLVPVAYAQLTLTPGTMTGQTNAFGAFAFPAVNYGEYQLTINAEGYVSAAETVTVSSPAISPVEIRLQPEDPFPTGAIAGIVTRSDLGLSVAGVTVTLMPNDISIETNALGAYVFPGLAYGDYTVFFAADGYESFSESVTIYIEGVVPVNASLVPLSTDPVGAIAGIVTNAWTFETVEGATVTLSPGEAKVQTGTTGTFLFQNLAYGEYTVQVSANNFRNTSEIALVDGTVSSVIAIALTPSEGEPTGTISGLVRHADTLLPIEGAAVAIMPGDIQLQTGAKGTFVWSGLIYREYTVKASADGYHTATETALLDSPAVALDILLTPAGSVSMGTIAGAVNDAATLLPIAGAQIILIPGGQQAQTNSLGLFSLSDIPYGNYVLGVSATGYVPDFSEVIIEDTVPVTAAFFLQPTGTSNEGENGPTGVVSGLVHNANTSLPMEGATVVLTPGDTQLQTGVTGMFIFTGLAYGEYAVEVNADAYDVATETTLLDSPAVVLDILLTPTGDASRGSIAGAVNDATTLLPIADATVTITPGNIQVRTGAAGLFRVTELSYGEYSLEVSAEGYEVATKTTLLDELAVFVDVLLTQKTSVETGSISGFINDAITRIPIVGAEVSLVPGGQQTETNDLGVFTFSDLPYADYILGAAATGYTSASAEISVDSPVPATTTFSLQPIDMAIEGEGEGEGEPIEGETTEGEVEGEPTEEEGEGEGESGDPTGCCRCQNSEKSTNWLFLLKEYWLLGVAMTGICLLNKRT